MNAKDVFIKYLQRCRNEYTSRKGHPGLEAVVRHVKCCAALYR